MTAYGNATASVSTLVVSFTTVVADSWLQCLVWWRPSGYPCITSMHHILVLRSHQ